jgi:hypothetical protein
VQAFLSCQGEMVKQSVKAVGDTKAGVGNDFTDGPARCENRERVKYRFVNYLGGVIECEPTGTLTPWRSNFRMRQDFHFRCFSSPYRAILSKRPS